MQVPNLTNLSAMAPHKQPSSVARKSCKCLERNVGNRTLAEDNMIRQGPYEPRHFKETDFWITQIPASSTSWASTLHIPEQKLRHDADKMIYTDGTYETGTQRAGAGVYTLREADWYATSICPSKPRPVNTINEAELIALLYALRKWKDCALTLELTHTHLCRASTNSSGTLVTMNLCAQKLAQGNSRYNT